MAKTFSELLKTYDVPVPRYTSYPAVPHWNDKISPEVWRAQLRSAFHSPQVEWSLYVHLPFCESLCTFCACNKIITRDHSAEDLYVAALLKEFATYAESVPGLEQATLRQIHLGGGSPTFFKPQNLEKFLVPILEKTHRTQGAFEGSVEIDPRRCTPEHLETLSQLGFQRASLGIQDFEESVQRKVNRLQSFSLVEKCYQTAREKGYTSINFDLIYGLPGQTEATMQSTAERTIQLRPDRIALYSLAFVPWIRASQKRFKEEELPTGEQKRALYEIARNEFLKAGYLELGIDHFVLPSDPMAVSFQKNTLHRNFMGYTEFATDVLLGLGVSAISASPVSFHQNQKELKDYYAAIDRGELPTSRGHTLTSQEERIGRHILNLMTKRSTTGIDFGDTSEILDRCIADGLVRYESGELKVTEQGRPFVRNICAGIDPYMQVRNEKRIFSSGV